VVPMGVKADGLPGCARGAEEVHEPARRAGDDAAKVTVVDYLDEPSVAVRIAGSCNALLLGPTAGWSATCSTARASCAASRARASSCAERVAWSWHRCVGSAIAASLAAAGVGAIALFDTHRDSAEALAGRLAKHYPALDVRLAGNDPAGYDLVVNGTPLGMNPGDRCPYDVARLEPRTFVGEVVMKQEITPLLAAARERGCRYQVGTDMLFE